MEDKIIANLDNPGQLESLYRSDKQSFKRAFRSVYPQHRENTLLGYWNERINYGGDEISWGTSKELVFVAVAAFIAGMIAKIPAIMSLREDEFYSRNIGFIVFPALFAWFAWKNKMKTSRIVLVSLISLAALFYINSLQGNDRSDTIILACIHLLPFLWTLTGYGFVGGELKDHYRRLGFLKYNGDLAVMIALVLISCGILTAVTIGLFTLINVDIEKFYFNYVVVFGLSAVPIVATYLTRTNPQLVGKVSPLIAKIFSPLVLVMLVIYLGAMIYSGKDPYNDRDFLIIFNALLIGVMAIIFFSVAESSQSKGNTGILVLLLLSLVTIVVNGIALSAIVFRIAEWGITPNRAAVLGGNVLILINLLMVSFQLYKVLSKRSDRDSVGKAIAVFLPVYFTWAAVVTFVFPVLFGFK